MPPGCSRPGRSRAGGSWQSPQVALATIPSSGEAGRRSRLSLPFYRWKRGGSGSSSSQMVTARDSGKDVPTPFLSQMCLASETQLWSSGTSLSAALWILSAHVAAVLIRAHSILSKRSTRTRSNEGIFFFFFSFFWSCIVVVRENHIPTSCTFPAHSQPSLKQLSWELSNYPAVI